MAAGAALFIQPTDSLEVSELCFSVSQRFVIPTTSHHKPDSDPGVYQYCCSLNFYIRVKINKSHFKHLLKEMK